MGCGNGGTGVPAGDPGIRCSRPASSFGVQQVPQAEVLVRGCSIPRPRYAFVACHFPLAFPHDGESYVPDIVEPLKTPAYWIA